MGRANVEAIELTRRHCRHARVELVDGNSYVGTMVGLPMGLLEVRCEHAPPPLTQGHNALELAIEFYQSNCIGCPHRDPSGLVPTLAAVVERRVSEEADRRTEAERAANERDRRCRERHERRRQLLAIEGYVVRDLAHALDRVDHADPRSEPSGAEDARAARQVIDAARGAPELFRPILVDNLLELATDTADPTAFEAVGVLVVAGRCPPREALDAACVVLRRQRSVDACKLLALLEPELLPRDLTGVIDQLISLASGEDFGPWHRTSSPAGLVAASRVDLPAVIERIIAHLASDDEMTRQAGAEAAFVLLTIDATRVVALGPPLAASVRGPDRGYAGDPHPTMSALGALAEAWRSEPRLTRQIVETQAASADEEVRSQLSRVPWLLQRFREPWDATDSATSEALDFMVRRASGDWGDDAAFHTADHLAILSREIPEAVVPHANGLLGAILALCLPDPDPALAAPSSEAAVERERLCIRRDSQRRHLADAVGRCCPADPEAVLGSVLGLFTATTGDARQDRAVKTTMLEVLEEAVAPATLRDILPITYTALLDNDQVVRSRGINLWTACDRVADALPTELAELALPLLQDPYVVVHKRMLEKIRELSLPAELAPRLLPVVTGWIGTYGGKPDAQGTLDSAIWALRVLARTLDDEAQVAQWLGVALRYVGRCLPYDRERLLTAWWPDELRDHPAWASAALATAASPELIDYYNQRREPVLQALMDEPWLIAAAPFAEIEPLSSVHGTAHPWRALEPVELLQSAGRWADAAALAASVERDQPSGAEGAPGRRLAGAVARCAELAAALTDGTTAVSGLMDMAGVASSGVAELEASVPDSEQDRRTRSMLDGLLVAATGPRLLLASVVSDPVKTANELDSAAGLLLGIPAAHASGRQRTWIGRSWQIAALLIRYDAAVRAAGIDALTFLEAARRQAEVLHADMANGGGIVPKRLLDCLAAVARAASVGDAQAAWRQIAAVPPPVSLVGTSLLRERFAGRQPSPVCDEPPRAVCVTTIRGVPVTDVLVVRPRELYRIGMTVRLVSPPPWAKRCIIEPITMLGRDALALPRYDFALSDGTTDEFGITLSGEAPLHCMVDQPVMAPALDCPIQVRLTGDDNDQVIEVSGFQRLLLRPFDPSRDALTEHEQTDARLLAMFNALASPEFDTEDARAFCRIFAACVRAAQVIMFQKTFMAKAKVTEAQFHDELERLLRADRELQGRLSRRDAVAGGFDDLLHDDIIVELKVSHGSPVTIERCARYLGQPTQYGVGRGSQLSVLVVFDHGRKTAPPGVIDNSIAWLRPRLHGLEDPRYPSLVGMLIVNTNLPLPSAWSRRRIETQPVSVSSDHQE